MTKSKPLSHSTHTISSGNSSIVKAPVNPIVVQPYEPGAQSAQQSAHLAHQKQIQEQMNMNSQHVQQGGTTCPQAAMHGMSSTPGDANQVSCATNNANWQRAENAKYDTAVGTVNPNLKSGGARKRKSRNTRNTRKRTHKKRSHTRRHHKTSRRHRRKSSHNRKHKRKSVRKQSRRHRRR